MGNFSALLRFRLGQLGIPELASLRQFFERLIALLKGYRKLQVAAPWELPEKRHETRWRWASWAAEPVVISHGLDGF